MKKLVLLVFIGLALASCSSPSGGTGGNSNGIVIEGYNLGTAGLWVLTHNPEKVSGAGLLSAIASGNNINNETGGNTGSKFKWVTTLQPVPPDGVYTIIVEPMSGLYKATNVKITSGNLRVSWSSFTKLPD